MTSTVRTGIVPALLLFIMLIPGPSFASGKNEALPEGPDEEQIALIQSWVFQTEPAPLPEYSQSNFTPEGVDQACTEDKSTELAAAVNLYTSYYGSLSPNSRHLLGSIPWEKGQIALHIFLPNSETSRGTIYLYHGYLEQALTNTRLISRLTASGFNVIAPDLPGHGFSTGEKGDIDTFDDYALAAGAVQSYVQERFGFEGAVIGIGHSTGCSVLLEAVHEGTANFDSLIFAAPLIRSFLWDLSQVGVTLARGFTDRIFRRTSLVSHDPFFQDLILEDPVQPKKVPFSWVDALSEWAKEVPNYGPINIPCTVIQGTADTVVDWKYNLPVLEKLFPGIYVNKIEGAYHNLLNEAGTYRHAFETVLEDALEQSVAGTVELP